MQNSQKLKGKIKKIGQPTRRLYRQEQHAGNRTLEIAGKQSGKKQKRPMISFIGQHGPQKYTHRKTPANLHPKKPSAHPFHFATVLIKASPDMQANAANLRVNGPTAPGLVKF